MKKLILCLSLACSLVARAQDVPEPEFPYRTYQVTPDGSLKNLDRTEIAQENSTDFMGRWVTFYVGMSDRSTLRLAKEALPRFIVKVEAGIDPADAISLIIGKVKKGKRKFQTRGKPEDLKEAVIKIEFKKLHDGVYEFLLPPLKAGEYAIICGRDSKMSCFGVD